jgi:hypothetical protein
LHDAPGTRGAASSRGDHLAPSTHVDDDDESAAADEEGKSEMNIAALCGNAARSERVHA